MLSSLVSHAKWLGYFQGGAIRGEKRRYSGRLAALFGVKSGAIRRQKHLPLAPYGVGASGRCLVAYG